MPLLLLLLLLVLLSCASPDPTVALYREAREAMRAERYETAAAIYDTIHELAPDDERAVMLGGLAREARVHAGERRALVEQWLRLTEKQDQSSLPTTRLARFPGEDTWLAPERAKIHDSRVLGRPTRDFLGPEIDLAMEEARMPGVTVGKGGGGRRELGTPSNTRTSWKPASARAGDVRLAVGDQATLAFDAIDMRVRVDGWRARVLMQLSFANTHDRQLEGTFQLRLPPGASPYFLAFGGARATPTSTSPYASLLITREQWRAVTADPVDAHALASRRTGWKAAKVAVMVARDRAASAYRDVSRQRVDPALLEWNGAGVFSCRVFPIQPKARHRVLVAYDVDLLAAGGADSLALTMPSARGRRVLRLDVDDDPRGVPTCTGDPGWTRQRGRARARMHFAPGEAQRIALRRRARRTLLVDRQSGGLGPLFASRVTVDLPAGASLPPRDAVFALDTSASGRETLARRIDLLLAILARNPERIPRFAVLRFDVGARWWRSRWTANDAAGRAAVRAALAGSVLEGATDLAAGLAAAARPSWQETAGAHDVFLLSDAAATWGARTPAALKDAVARLDGAVFAYRLDVGPADLRALHALTGATGGAVFSIADRRALATVAVAHAARPWRLEKSWVPGAKDVLLDGRPQVLYPGQVLRVAGRGAPADADRLILRVRRGETRKLLSIPLGARIDSPLGGRVYGQTAVGALELARVTGPAMTAYARHFKVPGRTASLLMLENESQYRERGLLGDAREDARQVKATLARALLATQDAPSDPRAATLAWLDRLSWLREVRATLPVSLRAALASLPVAEFAPAPAALRVVPGERATPLEPAACWAEATRRQEAGQTDSALRAVSSLLEGAPGDPVLLRELALRAESWGRPAAAAALLAPVVETRPHEAQTYLTLARCHAAAGRRVLALICYEIALRGRWPRRTGAFVRIAGERYRTWLTAVRTELPEALQAHVAERLRTLPTAPMEGLRVTLEWTTDATDVDLHVVEPSGEVCYYNNKETRSGGTLSEDVTRGFGPERYHVAKPTRGVYLVRVRYYGSDALRVGVKTRVRIEARLGARRWERVIDLADQGETLEVLRFELGEAAK